MIALDILGGIKDWLIQQAVGQAATLQAQQQLAAQNEAQNLAAQQIAQGAGAIQGVGQQAQNEQNILQGANTSFNNAQVAQQGNINNTNAQVAAENAKSASKTTGGIIGGIASGIAHFFGAQGGMVRMDQGGNVLDANARKHIAPEDFALPGRRFPIHDEAHARNALARVSQNGTPAEKKRVKEAVHKKYPDMGAKKMACGGEVKMAGGGFIPPANLAPQTMRAGPQSGAGQWINSSPTVASAPAIQQLGALPTNNEDFYNDAKQGFKAGVRKKTPTLPIQTNKTSIIAGGPMDAGTVPALPVAYQGGLAATGGNVRAGDGQKAEVKGDSLKNDKVPAMLSEGEIVLPRHITMSDRAPEKAAAFVAATLAKRQRSA